MCGAVDMVGPVGFMCVYAQVGAIDTCQRGVHVPCHAIRYVSTSSCSGRTAVFSEADELKKQVRCHGYHGCCHALHRMVASVPKLAIIIMIVRLFNSNHIRCRAVTFLKEC